jgi:polar amino acid transport system substrate-binding protein
MGRLLLSVALLAALSGAAFGQTSPASEIPPRGKLRVGMIAITVLGGVANPSRSSLDKGWVWLSNR